MFPVSVVCWLISLLTPAAQGQPVINEIHYDPPDKTQPAEFVELFNPGGTPISLEGWQLAGGVEFTFPDNTVLDAQGYLVVAQDPVVVQALFGVSALGPWTGRLRNENERVDLRDPAGTLVDRVGFQLGFPWPTVGTPPGYSIELIHPSLDNDLGGNWRASVLGGTFSPARTSWIRRGGAWEFYRGRNAPSSPSTAWRQPDFAPNTWESGTLPIGYDPSLRLGTRLDDMRGEYTSVYLRRTFNVSDPDTFNSIELQTLHDDGFKVWINGRFVLQVNVPNRELAFDSTASAALESEDYQTFSVEIPPGVLVAGSNVIAVHALNSSLSGSSDFYFDTDLVGISGPTGRGPTPGRLNIVHAPRAAPAVRQVSHAPESPVSGELVRITARITDPDGVADVQLEYQIVEPGEYIELSDPAYESQWTSATMRDDGGGGDEAAGDGTYTVVLPETLQRHRRLIRYRITATDAGDDAVRVPYPEDPQPNFAYFVYDGVPAWTGAIRPGDPGSLGREFTVPRDEMNRLPVLHLIAKRTAVEESTWFARYRGDAYPWSGTLVFRGRVHDHIHYRARGGTWRYAMTKNMWKFDFNRGHDFEAVDDWGRPLEVAWTKLNLGASIQQGDYDHRGEQGLFESVGFRMFQLAGIPAVHSAYAQFRVIDDSEETVTDDQYTGDFWGVYLLLEQPDGRFLKQHGLPDGNLYKMEGGGGEANNVGPAGPADGSDLNAFLEGYNGASEAWWRTHFDIANYLSYQSVVQAIHHYDICYDKNFFYYRNPENERWQVIPWDLDLTWADNMYDAGCGGVDRIKQRILPSSSRFPSVWRAWQNRLREFRDLFWNDDEAARLIDEQAGRLRGPSSGSTLLDADRAQWDYNPRMIDPDYTTAGSGKAGHGRFYRWPRYPSNEVSRDFNGGVQAMKNYIGFRATSQAARDQALDQLAADPGIPGRPTLTPAGQPPYPVNSLRLRCSSYQGSAPFSKLRWRIGEITRPTTATAAAHAVEPWKYEITPVWESGDLTAFSPEISVPAGTLQVGGRYRARVQFQDAAGRDSRWSAPLEFVAAAPLESPGIAASLRVSELMYNAAGGSTNDFLELHNAGTTTLDLGGLQFTQGIDFIIPSGTSLAPDRHLVITKAEAGGNFAGFRAHYGLSADVAIVGPYSGNLADGGEEVALNAAAGAEVLLRFTYSDGRGWPVAADGAGHSLVPRLGDQTQSGDLDYGGNWRISAFLKGSPGRADPEPDTSIVLNEIVAHTDFLSEFDSNDWVELFNRTDSPITLGDGWYLSDSADLLQRWQIPAGTLVPARGFISFDEVTGFNNPRGTGFSINKAGESMFLSYFPEGSPGRVVDAVDFKAQENDWALVRYPDGDDYWDAVGARTRGTPNAGPLGRVVISELLYHEGGIPTDTVPADSLEFIELHNGAPVVTDLHSIVGTWRINGGVSYQFDQPVSLAPGERILLVSWNPTLESTLLANFRNLFGIPGSVRVFGPYLGRLHNDTDRVALERPQAPDVPGDPITWVIVDEVGYYDGTPWPGGADGSGLSYQRRSPGVAGNDPAAWIAAIPSPGSGIPSGVVDTDGDSMPDSWELEHGLDPNNPGDAQTDADTDGSSNASEYLAGTNPRDATSVLRMTGILLTAARQVEFTFQAVAGRTYQLEARLTAAGEEWSTIQTIPPAGATADVTVRFPIGTADAPRFIRIRVP